MPSPSSSRNSTAWLLIIPVLFAAGQPAQARTLGWNGSSGTDFEQSKNWSPKAIPANDLVSDTVYFSGTPTANQPLLTVSRSINGFSFGSGGWTLSGGGFTLSVGASGITTTNATGTNTLNSDLTITLGAAQTWNIATGGTLQVDATINSSSAYALSIAGGGTLVLTGANSYTGGTTVSAGILNIQNSSALGSNSGGATVSSGATLQLQNNIAVGAQAVTINGTGASGQNGALVNVSGTNSYGGPVTLGSASTIDSDAGSLTLSNTIANGGYLATFNGAGNLTASGVISGTGGLTKMGAGTVTLNAASANTFTGNTTVSGGTFAANADGALGSTAKVTINTGGTLLLGSTAGNDRISNSAEVALAGGTLNTGGFSETVGKMTLSANSTLDMGTGISRLTFNGTSSLGSSTLTVLNWTGVQNQTGGTDQLIFTNSGFTPGSTTSQVQFNLGGTLYNSIFLSVGGSSLELVPVPEPSTIFGAGALVLAVGWRERRRVALLLRR